MSGSYFDTSVTSEDATAIAAGIAPAEARIAQLQEQSALFISAHGAAVNGGHGEVGITPPSLDGAE